jgi:hypothetical protein
MGGVGDTFLTGSIGSVGLRAFAGAVGFIGSLVDTRALASTGEGSGLLLSCGTGLLVFLAGGMSLLASELFKNLCFAPYLFSI